MTILTHLFSRRFARVLLLAAVAVGAALSVRTVTLHAQAAQPAVQPAVYLPMVTAQFKPGNPGDPGNPQPIRYTYFADPTWKTSNANIAVDKAGGIHTAYYYYEAEIEGRPTSAVYRFCNNGCDKPQNWQEVKLLDSVSEVQLALTSTGKPRLLIRANRDKSNGDEYYYGECNQGCATVSNWSFALVNVTGETALWKLQDDDQPQRSFALDNLDRPRFLQIDRNYFNIEPDRYGTYYMYCDGGCTTAANWGEVQVGMFNGSANYEMFEYPSLTFTGDGRPRIVAGFIALGDEDAALHYVACDSNCEEEGSWGRVKLWARGQGAGPGWDVAVDSQNRPRIAFYPESMSDGSGEQLYYAWCDAADCLQAGSWQRINLGLGVSHGGDPDLVMEGGTQPRIALVAGGGAGIGIMACDSGCDQAANWKDFLMDSSQLLEEEWNVPFAPTCVGGLWNGLTPSLVFDAKGNVRLVYDATYHAKCWWDTDKQEWIDSYQFYLIQRSMRGILVLQP